MKAKKQKSNQTQWHSFMELTRKTYFFLNNFYFFINRMKKKQKNATELSSAQCFLDFNINVFFQFNFDW